MEPEAFGEKSDALHGEKVGVGTLIACGEYHRIRNDKNILWNDYESACDKYIDIIKGFYATDMKKDEINGNNGGGIRWTEIIILSVAIAFIVNLLFIFRLNKYKVTSKKGEVMDKKINGSTLTIQQVQDSPSSGNMN